MSGTLSLNALEKSRSIEEHFFHICKGVTVQKCVRMIYYGFKNHERRKSINPIMLFLSSLSSSEMTKYQVKIG